MKIALIDHSFHKNTKSSLFFQEILKKEHDVTILWHDSWIGDDFINTEEINRGKFDIIIFWQIISKPHQIKKLNCKNIIWVPMYDTEIIRPLYLLQMIGYLNLNIKIISFSKTLEIKLMKLGFNPLLVQYYPKPNFIKKNEKYISIIFWQRINKINWRLIEKILGKNEIAKVYFKNNPDPQYKEIKNPPTADIEKYNIDIINGWIDASKYLDILKKCNIYIAPREYEGIGMGFLDAMATGAIVISPNKPTANEYIKDGYNGYLYDIKKPKSINLSRIKEVGQNLEKSFTQGYQKWQEQEKYILEFIKQKNFKINNKYKFYYSIYCLYYPILEILRKVKRLLKIKFY